MQALEKGDERYQTPRSITLGEMKKDVRKKPHSILVTSYRI